MALVLDGLLLLTYKMQRDDNAEYLALALAHQYAASIGSPSIASPNSAYKVLNANTHYVSNKTAGADAAVPSFPGGQRARVQLNSSAKSFRNFFSGLLGSKEIGAKGRASARYLRVTPTPPDTTFRDQWWLEYQ